MQGLQELRTSHLLDTALLDQLEQDLRQGGGLINHLHRRLGDQIVPIWRTLAERSQRAFIAQPVDAGPVEVQLLGVHDAFDYLVVPRVREFTTFHLMTPDPFARLSDYGPLRATFNAKVPGGVASLRLDIVPPSTFRELFSLAYPTAREAYRDEQDAAVLAALLPRRAQATFRPTPEEEASALANYYNLPYLDPVVDPPEVAVLGELPFEPFTARRLYPHSRNERGQLQVLGSVQRADELDGLHARVAALEEALQTTFVLILTSTRSLIRLFRTHQGAPYVDSQSGT
ncbi:hypothetical protein [Deinococcus ruber]|uniref:Uncharacterized protein n=1 Tax=Deinococcus ruber TaxID=1848197 RepID=A0A918C903_9DEIO|nr:hypothetical protein [Deinococcus ruber]GGR12763.1 hypothetical protein GCM10008957_27120 [Deinococcus ruber]